MKNSKNIKKYGLAVGLVALAAIAGIGAYFTGTDAKSDAYTIGSIEIENQFVAQSPENITPLYEMSYDSAKIANVGINDAFVFMTVDIPMAEVYTSDLDGNCTASAELKELFEINYDGTAIGAGWERVGEALKLEDADGAQIGTRYVFAYAVDGELTALAPDTTTENSIFSILKFINVADTDANGAAVAPEYNIEGLQDLTVKLTAYGIQTLNVKSDVAFTGDNEDGSKDPAVVWAVVRNALQVSEIVG
jgi:hypothetical protein